MVDKLPLVSEMYQLVQPESCMDDINKKIKADDGVVIFQYFKVNQNEDMPPISQSNSTPRDPIFKYDTRKNPIIMTSTQDQLLKGNYDTYLSNTVNYVVNTGRNSTYYSFNGGIQSSTQDKYAYGKTWVLEQEAKIDENGHLVPNEKVNVRYIREKVNIPYDSSGFDVLENFKFYLNNDQRHPIYPFIDGKKIFKFEANEAQKIFSLTFDSDSINNIIGYPKWKKIDGDWKKTGEYYLRGRLRLTLTYEASE